ncbi:dTDP-4-dehydrorhamnose reductase [soil metagenome]
MRLAVTGRNGQVAMALAERAGLHPDIEVILLGRPELDLADAGTIHAALDQARPEAIVSAAAYTAVDKAEADEGVAYAINAVGAGAVAEAAARLGVPILHLSTDYVFDGTKLAPYTEDDPVNPKSAYGRSKLAGEQGIVAATLDCAIFRTAWVFSPFGNNFVKTMLRLAADRDDLRVVQDQYGNPTSALDIADALIIAARAMVLRPDDASLRGIFHLSGEGKTHWADFAREIFSLSLMMGGPLANVEGISTAEYPTPAVRPSNSCLSKDKIADRFAITMPNWQRSLGQVVPRLLSGA